jgi:hypothetical protein
MRARPDHRRMSNREASLKSPVHSGGLLVEWVLADDPSTFTTKKGNVMTVIELRDPTRLGKSLVIWLEGDGEAFAGVARNSLITLRVDAVRSGDKRGELLADVTREAVEASFARARQAS